MWVNCQQSEVTGRCVEQEREAEVSRGREGSGGQHYNSPQEEGESLTGLVTSVECSLVKVECRIG